MPQGRCARTVQSLVVLALACSQPEYTGERPAQPAAASASTVGVVHRARDTPSCLTIADASLAPGDTLLLVRTEQPQGVGVARVEARRTTRCTEPGDEWGSVSIDGASFYTVRVLRGEPGDPAIALRSTARLDVRGGLVSGDLDGDGRAESFTRCVSNEGIHLRVVTRLADGRMRERWHAYVYVPYDLESTC